MILRFAQRLKRKCVKWAKSFPTETLVQAQADSTASIDKQARCCGGEITIGHRSSLVVEPGAVLNAQINIGDDCQVVVGRDSVLQNLNLTVTAKSQVKIGAGVIFGRQNPHCENELKIDSSTLILADKVRLMGCHITVRFGGVMTIGRYTGIGFGTEIRCEEKIDIGEYGMISYDVCIYDTNVHSTDWRKRRERIEAGYPLGAWEVEKPTTKPIWIGTDVWIGKGATITKGCVIEDRSIIGLRAVVGGLAVEKDAVVVSPKPRVIGRASGNEIS